MKLSCRLVSSTHEEVAKHIKPGINTKELDKIAEEFIRDNGGIPGFKGYNGFPYTLCISMNDEVVHGMPRDEEVKDGDVLSIDCGAILNDFYGDSAYTYLVGEIGDDIMNLMRTTKEALYAGIKNAIVGKRLGDISHAIQTHAEKEYGYGVVRELVGHGVGRNLHEGPEVPNYGRKGSGMKLKEGLVIAIEPMINQGTKDIKYDSDGWTVRTKDNQISAHYEHTIAVRKSEAQILSTFEGLENSIKNNIELTEIV
ncbi:UNVERIFIED_CONTAM: hypothetical protein GTU68_058770 [Idotea baltica]|nr:hypothetical protein [Idotea baltica]